LARVYVGVLLTVLALSSIVPIVVLRPTFAWTGSVHIRADGSIDPLSSPLQRNGTLYTLTGNISSDDRAIVIEKDNVILDGAGFTVQGLGSIDSVGVLVEERLNVTVRKMRVEAFAYGVVINGSSGIGLVENVVVGNLVGVLFQSSSFNGLFVSKITDNSDGIELHASLNNGIRGNFIQGNTRAGISLCSSENNTVVHNSFLANSRQVDTCPDLTNVWNEGYPLGGNWWGTSGNLTDVYSGPYQNLTGSDGICDFVFGIDVDNVDLYPLMGPWTDVGLDLAIIYSPEVSLRFASVVSGGVTIFNLTQAGQPAPPGFLLLAQPHIYYDVTTTAGYSGSMTLTLTYGDGGLTNLEENNIALVRWNRTSQQWKNVTVDLDIVHNTVSGETTSLSVFTLIVPLFGDINKDGFVDILDAILLSVAFSSTPANPEWNPQADINKDGVVDILDAIILSGNFGKT
jgi:parallel beta-helix repeat protein